jgi:hypothetical protein
MVQPTADALQQGVVTYDTPVDEFKVSVMKVCFEFQCITALVLTCEYRFQAIRMVILPPKMRQALF